MGKHAPIWYRTRRLARLKAGRCGQCGRAAYPFRMCEKCRLSRRRGKGIRKWKPSDPRYLPRLYHIRVRQLIDSNMDLVPTIKYPDELGMRYICLVRMAELHAKDVISTQKFRSLVKRRMRGEAHTQYLNEHGFRQTSRNGKCYYRRFTMTFTDAGMHDNSL